MAAIIRVNVIVVITEGNWLESERNVCDVIWVPNRSCFPIEMGVVACDE